MTGPIAAIDIGTNSVRLLVEDDKGIDLVRATRITRLGEGVDATGQLSPHAIERTLAVLREYAEQCRDLRVGDARATATSAARDAGNRDEFFSPAADILGFRPEVITGDEEATLSFLGATQAGGLLDKGDGEANSQAQSLVIDIGGGSTEFILGADKPECHLSIDIGSVRVTERYIAHDPPQAEELSNVLDVVGQHLDDVEATMPVRTAHRLVGVAGTVTTMAAMAAGITSWDPNRTHHLELDIKTVEELYRELASLPLAQRRLKLIEPDRAEVIVGGALILVRIMRQFGFQSLLVSEHDILDGIVASVRMR